MKSRLLFLWVLALCAASSLMAQVPTCPSTQSTNTDCAFMLTIGAGGTGTIAPVANAASYGGASNGSLVGIVNNSGAAFTGTFTLWQALGGQIFNFQQGSGICSVLATTPSYCNGAATGYEGPGVTFSNITSSIICDAVCGNVGTINIDNLAAGGRTYFALNGSPASIEALAFNGITIGVLGGGPGAGPRCPIIYAATNSDCDYILTINAGGTASITPVFLGGNEIPISPQPYDATLGNGSLVGVVNNTGTVFSGSFTLSGTFLSTFTPDEVQISGNAGIFDFSGYSNILLQQGSFVANDGICSFAFLAYCNNAATGYEGPEITFSNITPVGNPNVEPPMTCAPCGNSGTVNISNLAPNATTYFALQGAPVQINMNGGITVTGGGPSAQSGTVCPPIADSPVSCAFTATIGAGGVVTVAPVNGGPSYNGTSSLVGVVNNSGAAYTGSFVLNGQFSNGSGFAGIFDASDYSSEGICTYVTLPYCPLPNSYEGPLVTYSNVASTQGGNCFSCTGTVNINNLPAGSSTYFSIEGSPSEIASGGGLTVGAPPAGPVTPAGFPTAVVNTGPLGYFRLESSSGVSQVNGYTYNFSLTGATVASPGAPIGVPNNNYALLDGVSGQVTTSLHGGISAAGSMLAWVNLSALPSTQNNFSYVAGESQVGNDFDLQFDTNNVLRFYTTANAQNISYTPNANTLVGQWHMIVVTFDNSVPARAIYWDGALVANDSTVSSTNKTGNLQMGATSVFPGRFFPGGIDEVGVWNVALTPGQVAKLYSFYTPPSAPAPSSANLVALNANAGGLVRITNSDGTAVATIDSAVTGTDLVEDSSGNYALAAVNSLMRVTRAGTASTIINAPEGSQYISVSLDPMGNFIAADNKAHAIWMIASDGSKSVEVAQYPVAADILEDVKVRVDSNGNYIIADDNSNGPPQLHLYSMTPAGVVTPINLSGPAFQEVGGMTIDSSGNYFLADCRQGEIFKITPQGVTTAFANSNAGCSLGLAANLSSGLFFATSSDSILQIGANGANVTTYVTSAASLPSPVGLIVDVPYAVGAAPASPSYGPLTLTTPNLGTVAVGKSVSGTLSAAGGKAPYTYTATGTLPAGISIGGSTIGGTPTQPGVYSIGVEVTDAEPVSVAGSVSLSVFGITTTSLPNALTSVGYSQSIATAGSLATPITFSGSGLPPGISLGASGTLSGTTTKTGTYTLSIQATDANKLTATASLTLTVTLPPPIQVPAATLPQGTTGAQYSQLLNASGGAPPYTWSVASGVPPTNLTLNAEGVISGIPTKAGSYTFSARATDQTGGSSTGAITIVIASPPLTVSAPAFPAGVVGLDYPMQQISAAGGSGSYTFAVTTGSLPAGLNLSGGGAITGTPSSQGTANFTVTATDSSGATGTANLQLTIRPFSTDLLLSAGSLSFTSVAGAIPLQAPQKVQVQSTTVGKPLGYLVSLVGSPSWLSVVQNSGATPGSFSVALTSQVMSLSASGSPYQASITVTPCSAPGLCSLISQTVTVTLNLTSPPPQLSAFTDMLAFTASSSSSAASSKTLSLQNLGGGSIGMGAITSGASWLSVSGFPGSIRSGATVTGTVTANPAGLTAGFYRSTITFASSAGTVVLPVTLFIAANPSIALSPAGTLLQFLKGGAPGNAGNSFLVDVPNAAPVSWTATVQPGASWLSVTSATGSSSSAQPGTVNFAIDPVMAAGLTVGAYYGRIRIASTGVVNSPLDFEVVLNVSPPTAFAVPSPYPQGLLFLNSPITPAPPETVMLFANAAASTNYQASTSAAWLTVTPTMGSATATGSPSQVSINTTGLSPGVYYGGVNYAFSAAGVRTVNVTLVVEAGVPAAHALGTNSLTSAAAAAATCTPSIMVPAQVGLVDNFSSPAAWPTPLAVQLVDDCGDPIPNAQVIATFSNGDPVLPLALANTATGLYSGTWTPRSSTAQVAVMVQANAPGFAKATATLTGAVTPNNAPVLTPDSTLHVFNPEVGAGLGPGTIVQVYGQYLASQTTSAPSIPLATSLSGTQVIVGGITAPLYFVSPGQINFQLPYELTAGQQYQVLVSANGALTTPDVIQLTPVSPGLAALADGAVIAQHADGTLVTETSPAHPGENLVIYTAGLGDTNNPVTTGAASPSNPLASPIATPTLTVNSEMANILFAGLTPGLVGLYQVNFTVPADAVNGELPLVLTQVGVQSNSTILPVHN